MIHLQKQRGKRSCGAPDSRASKVRTLTCRRLKERMEDSNLAPPSFEQCAFEKRDIPQVYPSLGVNQQRVSGYKMVQAVAHLYLKPSVLSAWSGINMLLCNNSSCAERFERVILLSVVQYMELNWTVAPFVCSSSLTCPNDSNKHLQILNTASTSEIRDPPQKKKPLW